MAWPAYHPAWIGVGTLDLHHDECRDYAQRLRDAGVAANEKIAPGALHAPSVGFRRRRP